MKRIALVVAVLMACGGAESEGYPPIESRFALGGDLPACKEPVSWGWGPEGIGPAEGFCSFARVRVGMDDCEIGTAVFVRPDLGPTWAVVEVGGTGCH